MESIENFEKSPGLLSACGVLKDAVLHPNATFSQLPVDGPWLPSTAIALVLGAIVWCDQVLSLRAAIAKLFANPQFADALSTPFGRQLLAYVGGQDQGWFATFVAGLPTVPMGLFAYAIGVHVCLVVCGASSGGLKGTWRVLAYTSTGALLGVIPWVGGLLSLVVVSIQLVAGLTHIHRVSTARVLFALALPLLLVCALIIGAIVLVLR